MQLRTSTRFASLALALGSAVPWLVVGLMIGTFALGVHQVRVHEFVQDDAYIAYRYAKNFADGNGLVYNPGEYVEGYTDPLWVVLMAGAMKLGIRPFQAARVIGWGSHLLATALVFLFSWSFYTRTTRRRRVTDVAPFLVIGLLPLNQSWAAYATGGLETSMFRMLALLAMTLTLFYREAHGVLFVASNLSFLALCLTRPDGLLFYGVANLALCVELLYDDKLNRGSLLRLMRWNAPFAVLFGAYLCWKFAYYGQLVPNTFHTKSVAVPYFQRGWVYLWGFYSGYRYPILAFAGPVAVALALLASPRWVQVAPRLRRAAVLYLLPVATVVVVFNGYVGWVGGGFMEWKPLMHVYPLTITTIVVSLLALQRIIRYADFVVPVLVVVLLGLAPRAIPPSQLPENVLSTKALMRQMRPGRWVRIGKELGEKLPADTVIATSAAGAIPYFSGLVTVDIFGLTDAAVGRKDLLERGVVGHEKVATLTYLSDRGVNLVFRGLELLEHDAIPAVVPRKLNVAQVYINIDGRWILANYLTPTPKLDALFSAESQDFIVVRPAEALGSSPPR